MLSAGWIDTPTSAAKSVYHAAHRREAPFMHLPADAGRGLLSHRGVIAAGAILDDPGDKGGG